MCNVFNISREVIVAVFVLIKVVVLVVVVVAVLVNFIKFLNG